MWQAELLGQGSTVGRTAVPQESDASAFGADCMLVDAFAIACGLPLYYVIGIPSSMPLMLAYVASVVGLVALTPYMVWLMHWGLPVPLRVRRITMTSLLYLTPMLILALIVIALEMQRVFLGVAIMGFAAAVLIAVAGERFRDYPAPTRLVLIRVGAAVLTPAIVLLLTQWMPHGVEIVAGWAIPVPAVAVGALGAARGFSHQMALRDRLISHS
ncbi:MAG: hypothetical protein KJ747_07745 [Actinobacteria bacterium]|nr:hypothetical protein [Actinomycetota bacterium]MCG2808090.1 hypothetical protein [Coriobacteriia bacterium]